MISALKTGKDIRPLQTPQVLILSGLTLGALADRLWVENGFLGAGFVVWASLFAGAANAITIWRTGALSRELLAWSALGVCAALLLVFRSAPFVIPALLLLTLTSAAMGMMQTNGRSLRDTDIIEHLRSLGRVPRKALLATAPLLARLELGLYIRSPRLRTALRGLLLALPLLVLFSLLFASADAAFSHYAERFFTLLQQDALEHLLIIGILAWLSTGLLAGVSERHYLVERKTRRLLMLGTEDTAVLLGMLVLLFLGFVALQLGYLFGGAELIQHSAGLTVAEYARRGFFEMVIASALSLIILVAVARSDCNPRVFRPLGAILLACVAIMLISAAQRMALYVTEFGLSLDRMAAIAVMIWLAGVLLLFTGTLLMGRQRDFAAGVTLAGVFVVLLWALLNPAAIVARVNLDRTLQDQQPLDTAYLQWMGTDAVPTLMNRFELLPQDAQCQLMPWLRQYELPYREDWRWWSASRAAATKAVQKNAPELDTIAESCGR
ncbi:MAG: DUF4173 domain-containing protein [Pseudomonadales bacterium]|nr:DUF4173 domain-containing protein [Pseudomonadales bacterium]MCP5330020.1 DUF4173 domain-containing protein [Pseudomonadales bacterium]MCP5343071.1 DUF4173 domain-containing protein [Pseudomonadales bacterium]